MAGNSVRIATSVTGAKGAASDLDRLRDKFDRLQKQGAKGFAIGAGAAATTAALGAVGMGLRAVTGYLGDSAAAFKEEQVSIQRLTTSLRANVDGWDGTTDAIERVLQARLALGFSDDEQRESLSALVAAYGDVNKALEAQRTAMDLARFSGVDLASASDVLVKVHAGNYRALKALGINTAEVTNETQALAAVQKVAAGQAEDYAQTLEGKLVVAEVEAGEASEKFGKQVARLQAEILPALTDVLSDAADGFDDFQLAMDDTAPPTDRAQASIDILSESMIGGLPIVKEWVEQAEAMLHPWDDAAQATFRAGERVDLFADAASNATPDAEDLADEVEDVAHAARKAEREIDDLADTISDELFGDAINAGNLADLRKTHDELVKQREAARKGSREWKILTGEIAENDQALFELQLQMKEKEGPNAVIAWLRRQKALFGDTSGAIQRLIDKYRTLNTVSGALGGIDDRGSSQGSYSPGRAAGGPVAANKPYVVGEEGPELFVPGASGTIIPNDAMASGGTSAGGVWQLNVNVTGAALTPAISAQLAREIGPALVTYLRDRRLV